MEALERIRENLPKIKTSAVPELDEFEELKQRIDERAERYREEERIFRERLLETLERQNTLLERLAAHLGQ